ncbi:hypothetical protein JB92DRAFT_765287 [Gautieria morchelliformis]|nr:hypothetical protein JB92DRAFT_765287 [Gautieria morchelliformis]
MPRTTAPSTNPRILSGYAPYADHLRSKCSASATEGRRQLLLDDPHARDVQPEQVTCTRCTKTVRLQKGKKYHLAHWLDHRWRCDRETTDPPPRAKCLTLIERKAALEADKDAEVVESDRVVCGRCGREVKLRKGRPYGLSCWNQHKSMCYMMSPQPSVPARSASGSTSPSLPHPDSEKHMYNPLISDPLVASIEPQRIKCALCLTWIDFGPSKDLVWHRHRTSCVADNVNSFSLPPLFPCLLQPSS